MMTISISMQNICNVLTIREITMDSFKKAIMQRRNLLYKKGENYWTVSIYDSKYCLE